MNILFFLTPKNDVAYVLEDDTIMQALEKMEQFKYTAIPVISKAGKYIGTVTEGDFLWMLMKLGKIDTADLARTPLSQMERHMKNQSVSIDADIEDLITMSIHQNFVPVVDDDQIFIGIVTRKEILQYCSKKCF